MNSNIFLPKPIMIGKRLDFTDKFEQISFEEFITQELEYLKWIVFVNWRFSDFQTIGKGAEHPYIAWVDL